MADDKPTSKRRVKDPETFRERALKAADEKSTGEQKSAQISPITKALKAIFSPIGRGYRKLEAIKVLHPLFVVLDFIGKILYPPYIRSSIVELKKITWPSWKQSRKLTYAVLAFAIVFGATIALVDYGLSKVFKHLLLK